MVKGLKSLLAGTALLALTGCVTYTTTTYPSSQRYPVERVAYTESFWFSMQNVPSHHQRQKNFSNPTYNGRSKPSHHGHHDYSGQKYRK